MKKINSKKGFGKPAGKFNFNRKDEMPEVEPGEEKSKYSGLSRSDRVNAIVELLDKPEVADKDAGDTPQIVAKTDDPEKPVKVHNAMEILDHDDTHVTVRMPKHILPRLK